MITLIAAMDEGHLIGRGNELPWQLPGDLRRFRMVTMDGALITARKTWQSLPGERPYLDGRVNCIITRTPEAHAASVAETADPQWGPFFFDSIEAAIEHCRTGIAGLMREIFVMGGREIYAASLKANLLDRMLITHVKGQHEGDVFFPEISADWVGRLDYEDRDGLFDVLEYVRRPEE